MADEQKEELQTNERYQLDRIVNQLDLNKIQSDEMEVAEVLAAGGQGKVLLCTYYGTKVILKTLHRLSTKDYTNEVTNVYKYRHPNIPKFIGIYDCPKNYGLVFEYVEGITLSKQIQLERNGVLRLSLLQKLDYMIQLVCAVELLHDHELIHRDLKTANVMIDSLGNLKLLDFGIAIEESKGFNLSLESTDFALTPTYIPPEILLQNQENDSDDENSDSELLTKQDDMRHANSLTFPLNLDVSKNNKKEDFQKIVRSVALNNVSTKISDNLRSSAKISKKSYMISTGNLNNIITNNNLRSSNKFPSKIYSISTGTNKGMNTSMSTTSGRFTVNHEKKNMGGLMRNFADVGEKVEETTVNITNKFDIWTIGLILSEYFTLIRPWGRNDKESRTDLEIRALIFRKVPFFTPKHDRITDPVAYETIQNLIKKCTEYDPEKRPTVSEIKKDLTILFNEEIKKQKIIEDSKNIGIKNKELDPIELLKYKRAILLSNENQILKSNLKSLLGKDIIAFPNMKADKENKNNLVEGLIQVEMKKSIQFKHQQISILDQKIFISKQNLESNSDNSKINNKSSVSILGSLFKKIYFSTYNETLDQIIIAEFPMLTLEEKKDVMCEFFGKSKLKYRNPFCLNISTGLFMIGGLIKEENEDNERLSSLPNKSCYSSMYKIHGTNYIPTNKCYFYEYKTSKTKRYPLLNSARLFFGCIYINGVVWVIGGGNKRCEVLNYLEYIKNLKNQKYLWKWNYSAELVYDVVDPMISFVRNDTLLVFDGRQSFESIKENQDCIIYQWLYLSDNNYDNSKFNVGKVKVNLFDFLEFDFFIGTFFNNENETDSNGKSNLNIRNIYITSRYSKKSNKFDYDLELSKKNSKKSIGLDNTQLLINSNNENNLIATPNKKDEDKAIFKFLEFKVENQEASNSKLFI